jgi:hypothetical protein
MMRGCEERVLSYFQIMGAKGQHMDRRLQAQYQ